MSLCSAVGQRLTTLQIAWMWLRRPKNNDSNEEHQVALADIDNNNNIASHYDEAPPIDENNSHYDEAPALSASALADSSVSEQAK